MNATITGWGKCTPPAVLTNDDLASVIDTSDEWITSRSGIKERRISHVANSDMATLAGRRAIAAAGLEPKDIDYIILATCTADRLAVAGSTPCINFSTFLMPRISVSILTGISRAAAA